MFAEVDDLDQIEDGLEDFVEFMEDEGFDSNTDRLGPHSVKTVSLRYADVDDPFRSFDPGYMILEEDNVVAIGSTIQSLEQLYDTTEGSIPELGSESGFDQLLDMAPEPVHFLLYANIAGISDFIEDSLHPDNRAEYRDEVRPFVDLLDRALMTTSVTEDITKLTMILTLRE